MDGHFGIGIMLINPTQNFNLINVTTNDDILPTKYFLYFKKFTQKVKYELLI